MMYLAVEVEVFQPVSRSVQTRRGGGQVATAAPLATRHMPRSRATSRDSLVG